MLLQTSVQDVDCKYWTNYPVTWPKDLDREPWSPFFLWVHSTMSASCQSSVSTLLLKINLTGWTELRIDLMTFRLWSNQLYPKHHGSLMTPFLNTGVIKGPACSLSGCACLVHLPQKGNLWTQKCKIVVFFFSFCCLSIQGTAVCCIALDQPTGSFAREKKGGNAMKRKKMTEGQNGGERKSQAENRDGDKLWK